MNGTSDKTGRLELIRNKLAKANRSIFIYERMKIL
jgi:hypothetical protein